MNKIDILVIDDVSSILEGFKRFLTKAGYKAHLAPNGRMGLELFKKLQPPVTILDLKLPDMTGLEVMAQIRQLNPEAIVIMITAFGESSDTIEAYKLGVYDFLRKPGEIERDVILEKVRKGLEKYQSQGSKQLQESEVIRTPQIIGNSSAMQDIYKLIGKIATTAVPVLITGESGVGKEVIARIIHQSSPRTGQPFVPINCTAIPEHLIESELFGHEKGAFTGAVSMRRGKFELADSGTLFLDEIADMPMEMQAKLLRVLQEQEFVRVGGTEEKHVDTRIIAATNANLEKAIQGGRLREDLYHRLKVIQVHLPPLRERKDDIPALLAYFLDRANGEMNRNISGLSMEARNLILSYHWPGNVRELENAIRSAAAICMDNQIGMEHLPPELERAVCGTNLQNPTTRDLTLANIQPHYSNSLTGGPADFQTLLTNLQEVVRQELTFHIENMGEIEDFDFHSRMLFPIEKILIEAVLDKFNGNQVKTAKFLGINRNTLRSRMEKFNCDLENSKK